MTRLGGGELSARGQAGGMREEEEQEAEEAEGYQAISDKETTDLSCRVATRVADAFTDRLAKELSVLGGDNIHSMMASEVRSWRGGLECNK